MKTNHSLEEIEAAIRRKRAAQGPTLEEVEAAIERKRAKQPSNEEPLYQRALSAIAGNAAEDAPALLQAQPLSFNVGGRRVQSPIPGLSFGQPMGVDSAAALGDDDDVARAYLRQYPEAKLAEDANGNPMIEHNGRRMYVNQPGLDVTDVVRFGSKVASYLPATRLAGAMATVPMRFGVGGLGAGATDAAMQVGAGRSASDFSPTQVAIAGGTGATAELLAPAIGAGRRYLQGRYGSAAKQTQAGQTMAATAGIDDVSPEGARSLALRADEVKAGADPRAILAEQEFGYKLTRGQLTGDEQILRKEEFLRATNPNGPIGQLERQNLAQTEANVGRFREMAARGGTPEAFEQDAAQRMRDALDQTRKAGKQEMRQAYREVPSQQAFAGADDVAELPSRLDEALISQNIILTEQLTPATMAARKLVSSVAERAAGTPLRMDQLIELRKALSRMRGSAVKEDSRAYAATMKEFDGWFDASLTRNLMADGGGDAVKAFRDANKVASKFFSQFEDSKSEGGKAIMRMLVDDATPEQVANVLLNASGINKPGAAAIAKRYIETVGKDSDGVTAMREIIARRLFEKAGDPKGHQAIVSSLKDALNGRGRSLMSTVYNKTELAMMEKFARTLDDFFVPKGMLGKSSGSAERFVAFMAPLGNIPFAKTIRDIGHAMAQRAATKPLLASRPAAFPASVTAGVTGYEEDRRRRQSRGGQRP